MKLKTKFNWMYEDTYNMDDLEEILTNSWECRWQLFGKAFEETSAYIMLMVEKENTETSWSFYAQITVDADELGWILLKDDQTKYESADDAKVAAEEWFTGWLNKSFGASITREYLDKCLKEA